MRITPEQCDEVLAIIQGIRDDLPTLYELDRRLASVETFDGFRTSVRPMDGGPASVLDEDGFPVPPLSDPTGNGVVSVLDGTRKQDSVRKEVALMASCFAEIRGLARQADGARGRAMVPDGKALDPEQCEVHKRHAMGFAAVHRSGRCRWCYDFWLAEGVDPPAELLKAYGEGRRINQAMVAAALRHQPKAKSKRKRKAG